MPGVPQAEKQQFASASLVNGGVEWEILHGDDAEDLTDTEVLNSDDQMITEQKRGLLLPDSADVGLTDTEMMNTSGDEEDPASDKEDICSVSSFLPDDKNEVVNQTEGYKGDDALSGASEGEDGDADSSVYGRHLKNIKETEKNLSSLDQIAEPQVPTDSEDINDSADDVDEDLSIAEEATEESTLPEVYLEPGGSTTNTEAIKPLDLTNRKKNGSRSRSKRMRSARALVNQEDEEALTDVEELEKKESGPAAIVPAVPKRVQPVKIRRKKMKKSSASKTKIIKPPAASDYETDSECLVEDESQEDYEEGNPVESHDTDQENYVDSGDDVEDFMCIPVEKEVPFEIPEPHRDLVCVNEVRDVEPDVEQENTDEEGFEIGEQEDDTPLPKIDLNKYNVLKLEDSDVEEYAEEVDTDDDDLDLDEHERNDIVNDLKTWRRATESNILEVMDCTSGTETNIGKWKNAVTNIMKTSFTVKSLKLCLPSKLSYDELQSDVDSVPTDEENYNEDGELITKEVVIRLIHQDDESSVTGSESVEASDDEILETVKKTDKGKRLPIVPQLSEIRFLETEQGPLSLIITPDDLNNPNVAEIADNVPGVVFLENEEGDDTDVEDLQSEDDKVVIKIIRGTPLTDSEDFEDDRDICRPETPIPPNIEYSVLSSPKRERIFIKEDKYGVPQVKIEKMSDEFLAVVQDEERPSTAIENIEITLDEALRIFGFQETERDQCSDISNENSEITAKLRHRITKHLSVSGPGPDDEQVTDVEEIDLRKKRCKKSKKSCKGNLEEIITDTEDLCENDGQACNENPKSVPVISTDEDTNSEGLEVSASEDIFEETYYPLDTPEVIRKFAVKRTEIYKEGPNRTTGNVIIEPAQVRSIPRETFATATDTEDIEASAGEDDVGFSYADSGCIVIDGDSTKVTQSEEMATVAHPDEEMALKDRLMYPPMSQADLNTDVESLDGLEGNRN